jgi:hypothetical protein
MKKQSETSQGKSNFRIKIGLKPLQSDFNKRAAEYAKRSAWAVQKKKKLPQETP